MTEGNLISFRVDFSAVDAQGWVKTRRQFNGISVGGLQTGLVVAMDDYDDNTCLGVITEVRDSLVRIQPVLETWSTGFRLSALPTVQYAGVDAPETLGSEIIDVHALLELNKSRSGTPSTGAKRGAGSRPGT